MRTFWHRSKTIFDKGNRGYAERVSVALAETHWKKLEAEDKTIVRLCAGWGAFLALQHVPALHLSPKLSKTSRLRLQTNCIVFHSVNSVFLLNTSSAQVGFSPLLRCLSSCVACCLTPSSMPRQRLPRLGREIAALPLFMPQPLAQRPQGTLGVLGRVRNWTDCALAMFCFDVCSQMRHEERRHPANQELTASWALGCLKKTL